MARLVEKPSRAPASRGGGTIPDFPKFHPSLANVPGAQETNAQIQRWNDLMKRRWVLLDEDLTHRFSIDAGFQDEFTSLQASLELEQLVRANADFALAQQILTLEATFDSSVLSLQAQITAEELTRASADSALSTSISIVSASVGALSATVSTLSSALATANNYLESRWTVAVSAGPIVTGMTLFSASGPDTEVSYVAFQTDRFLINTASGGNKQIFAATSTEVKLGDVLTVNLASQKIHIGTGTFADVGTPFYVDASANFSLGNKLQWNGTTLTIVGGITATTGTIGGWAIASTTLSNNNAVLDSAGQLYLGTSNDIVVLSATDATYRIWIGNATSGSAAFRVTKTGLLTATNAVITGVITATSGSFTGTVISSSGTIGGYTIGATDLTGGSGSTQVFLSSNAAAGIILGATSALRASSVTTSTQARFTLHNSSNILVGLYSCTSSGDNAGFLQLWDSAGSGFISLEGAAQRIVFSNDTNLYRSAANTLKTDDAFHVAGVATFLNSVLMNPSQRLYFENTSSLTYIDESNGIRIHGDSSHPIKIVDGDLEVQTGIINIGSDTNLYRWAANNLRTDDSLYVAGGLNVAGSLSAGSFSIGSATITTLAGTFGSFGNDLGVGNGTVGQPALYFLADPDTGWRWNASGDMRGVTNGADRLVVRDGAIVCLVPLKLDNARAAGAPVAGGTVNLQDSSGATVQALVV
jgi:hypothetical protein